MKNQIKKSLSLIMAVLMLMSCWVWVAPEKAEAADSFPQYKITLTGTMTTVGSKKNGGHYKVYYFPYNTDGSINYDKTEEKIVYNSWLDSEDYKNKNGDVTIPTYVDGFPCGIQVATVKNNSDNYRNFVIKGISIGEKNVNVTGSKTETGFDQVSVTGSATKTLQIDKNGNKSGDWGSAEPTLWKFPEFGVDTSASTKSLTINGINASATADFVLKDIYYGVDWAQKCSAGTPSIKLNSSSSAETGMSATASKNSVTVKSATGADHYNEGKSTSNWTLTQTFTCGTKKAEISIPVTLNHPTYTVSFNANGGKLDTAENAADITGLYYGSKILTGKKDPTVGASNSGRTIDKFTAKQDGTGRVLDTTEKTTTCIGNETFYAQWKAAPVDVKFVMPDGQLIGVLTEGGNCGSALVGGSGSPYSSLDLLNKDVKASHKTGTVYFSGNNPSWTQDGLTYQFVGWKVIFAKDLEGNEVDLNSKTHTTAVLQGETTFQAVFAPTNKKDYSITFYGADGTTVLSKKDDYKYGDPIVMPATATKSSSNQYSYTHIGWAPKIGNTKYYSVDENNLDLNGGLVSYISKDTKSFFVEGNNEYVPVFRHEVRSYNVTYNYYEDSTWKSLEEVLPYGTVIEVPAAEKVPQSYTEGGYRYTLQYWDCNGKDISRYNVEVKGNTFVTAQYDEGNPAVYTIRFFDKYGNQINAGNDQYAHNTVEETVKKPSVGPINEGDQNEYDIPYYIDTEDALFTFENFYARSKDGERIDFSPLAERDIDYYAEYSEKVYADVAFYNYDGTLIYELKGKDLGYYKDETNIPDYDVDKYGIPVKPADKVGIYTFTGWADSEGKLVEPGKVVFSGDTHLIAQFETEYKNYTVKFLNGDDVISSAEYHYGAEIVIPEETPTKAEDETYTYQFRNWSPDVSEICYDHATYSATYVRSYKYYTVTWLKSDKSHDNTTSYIYNERIQQGSTPQAIGYGEAGEGYTWALKEWIRCNANGEPVDAQGNVVDESAAARFVRGDRMGIKALYFYPTYVKKPNDYTVTFYDEDGSTKLGEITASYGESLEGNKDAEAIENLAVKAHNETQHFTFAKWVMLNGNDVTDVKANLKVKAFYTAEDHNKQIYEVIKAPTCMETGLVNKKCLADSCNDIEYNVVVPVIPDTAAPDGQVYVGDNVWMLNEYSSINYEDVVYVGPSAVAIVNAVDTNIRGGVWNPEGKITRRVGSIDVYVASNVIAAPDTIPADEWLNVYSYDIAREDTFNQILADEGLSRKQFDALADTNAKKIKVLNLVETAMANYQANATGRLADLNLADGEKYIIYVKVSDRELNGSCNTAYFSSGMFHYGETAPVISISGDGYKTLFCSKATISVTDDTPDFTVELDGEEITLANGAYLCEKVGVHTVTVTDKNGNVSVKKFEIKGNHVYKNHKISPTCTTAGEKYDVCTLCGVKTEVEVIPALGHKFVNYTERGATCTADGYRIYVCSNNCNQKLTLTHNSASEDIAKALKYVTVEGQTEAQLVSITAADLAHLKANGNHTYAMVKDANGNDTAEYAWVIDIAANCVTEGSRHRDCTICGILGRVTEAIGVDSTKHNFYMAKVTKKPTCTETGEKTRTCKYNNEHVEVVETIPALGHIAGKYEVIKPATCEEKGSEVLLCATCKIAIGEADEEGKFNTETPVTKEIPALQHAWEVSGEPVEEQREIEGELVTVWVQYYTCANGCGKTSEKILDDYQPPVPATVTFKNGEDDYKVIQGFVGNVITAAQIGEVPVKAADETYKYSFSHWATKDADGKLTEVKLPVEVEGDATYYAVFAEKYINYEITYYYEDGVTEYKKVGYLHYGDKVTLVDGPSKAGTKILTYSFAGWKTNGTNPVTYNGEVEVKGDMSLIASYGSAEKMYAVTYAISSSDILETFEVTAGTAARDCYIVPEKAADSKYHYEFTGWNKATQLKNVESNIYTTPEFKGGDHTFEKITLSDPTCTQAEKVKYVCEECKYSYEAEGDKALGHKWNDTPVLDENGKSILSCSRNCGEKKEDDRKFTVKFYNGEELVKTSNYILWGSLITSLPTEPTKEADSTNEYKFVGWAYADGTVADFTTLEVKSDLTFYAKFDTVKRTYTVTFAYDATKVIKVFYDVEAGSNVTYEGAEPVKAYDDNYHYKFKGWSNDTTNIQGNVTTYAEFNKIGHSYTEHVTDNASCTHGEGVIYKCNCGYSYSITGNALGHNFIVETNDKLEPANGKDGYIVYKCERCDETQKKVIPYDDNKITIKVTVVHNGAPAVGVRVEVQSIGGDVNKVVTTNANGVATVDVSGDYEYSCWVTVNGKNEAVTLTNANGGKEGTYSYTDKADCSCACHRDNLWGTIFRFFHKIIKLFTGEFKCCTNPDPMYG